jgi:N-acyl-D-aspartate/D-glutamate deacylase
MVGDLNVIDHDTLGLRRPELVNDLPGRARRLVQRADGYVATFKAGQSVLENAEATGAAPGHLLRGARTA